MMPHETVTEQQTVAGLQWLSQSNNEVLSGIKSTAKSGQCNTHHAHVQTGSGIAPTIIHFLLLIETVGSEKG